HLRRAVSILAPVVLGSAQLMTNPSTKLAAFEAHKKILRALLKHFPTIALVMSAVIYATGFLVVFTFLDSYRLRGVDTDLFKVRFFMSASCSMRSWEMLRFR